MFTVPAAIRRGGGAVDPPIFTGTIDDITGTDGQAIINYDASVHFTTGGAVETYSLTGTNVPWLQINSVTGEISGTPTDDTDYTGVTVTGTNASDSDTSNTFAVTIEAAGGGLGTDFAMTVTIAADNGTFTLPTRSGYAYNMLVKWGDGQEDTITSWDQAEITHQYATAGDYQIRISGTMETLYFRNLTNDRGLVKSVDQLGEVGWVRCEQVFWGCNNITSFTAGNNDTGASLTFLQFAEDLFGCTSMDLTGLDLTNADNLTSAFRDATGMASEIVGLNTLNTSSVVTMPSMFRNNKGSMNVSSWNISSLTTATDMFRDSGLTDAQYDALLIGWAAQAPNINSGVTFSAGTAQYSAGAAADARDVLDITYGWTITDGGPA